MPFRHRCKSDPSCDSGADDGAAAGGFIGVASLIAQPVVAAAKSFLPSSVGPFARRNFRHEMTAMTFWPFVVTMIEGPVVGVIAIKAFPDTPGWIIATLAAAPAFSSITSSLWTRFAQGRMLVRSVCAIQIAILALIGLIACVPMTPLGLYLFTAAAVLARVGMTGVITLRSVLWRANYERHERARITGKLITIQTLIIAGSGQLVGWFMDINEASFRIVYPASLTFGFVAVWFMSRLRVRRPFLVTPADSGGLAPSDQGRAAVVGTDAPDRASFRAMLQQAGRSIANGSAATGAVPAAGRAIRTWGRTVGDMARVLRDDRAYRGYMMWMFVLGIGNLAVVGPLIPLLHEQFNLDYRRSLLLLQAIPLILIPVTIPIWARLLDRVHIIRFRAIHAWAFVLAHGFLCLGAILHSLPLITLSSVARGIAFGGGALAWNIGHNDFSTADRAGLYMTIHVTLTGIRGLIGAYLGIWLYTGLAYHDHQLLPSMGAYSFLVWLAVNLTGAIGFVALDRRLAHISRSRPPCG